MKNIFKIVVGVILGEFARKTFNKLTVKPESKEEVYRRMKAEHDRLRAEAERDRIQAQARPIRSMSDLDDLWRELDAQATIEPSPGSAMNAIGRFA